MRVLFTGQRREYGVIRSKCCFIQAKQRVYRRVSDLHTERNIRLGDSIGANDEFREELVG